MWRSLFCFSSTWYIFGMIILVYVKSITLNGIPKCCREEYGRSVVLKSTFLWVKLARFFFHPLWLEISSKYMKERNENITKEIATYLSSLPLKYTWGISEWKKWNYIFSDRLAVLSSLVCLSHLNSVAFSLLQAWTVVKTE